LDWDVSVLGVGAGVVPGASPGADCSPSDFVELFRRAVDNGVNYLDLGWFSGMENCSPWSDTVGAALADGYRERVRIAANVPPATAGLRADWVRFIEDLTGALGVDGLDFCIVGGMDRSVWERLVEAGLPEWADRVVEEGPVAALGFDICDDSHTLNQIVTDFDGWSVCKMRYGFWDHLKSRPGSTGVRSAADRGLMVVAAEPTQGALAWHGDDTAVAKDLSGIAGLDGSIDEWSLRWIWDDPGVSTVVCDLTSEVELSSWLDLADGAEPRSLSISELTALSRVKDHYVKTRPLACTACRTCMPCPEGIDIPRILDLWNDASAYGGIDNAWATFGMERHVASACTACGRCEETCPWKISIIQSLQRSADLFERRRGQGGDERG
jgi:hypothetical protein